MDASKKQKNIFDRQCRECGNTFKGGPRAWYCPSCRAERMRAQNRDFKTRKRSGDVVPLGSIIKCKICGVNIVKNSGLQEYCAICAEKHLKDVDNQQSQEWKRNNKDKYLKAKRDFDKRRRAEQDSKPTGQKYISFDKAHRKYRVVIKGKHIGYFTNLDDAITARDKINEYS